MKPYLTIVFCLFALLANAQSTFQHIDRNAVQAAVTDANQATYYPKLVARLAAFDTTLTAEEYRNLYYGFVFESGYNGYIDHKKREINALIKAQDYAGAVTMCDEVLSKIPISLNANYLKGYALFQLDKTNPQAAAYRTRYRKLRDAILASGDGLTCESAFKTIFIDDEYDIMYHYFEVEGYSSQSLVTPCDRFSIEPSKYFKASAIYFDTSETLLSMRNMLGPDKTKKRQK